MSTHDDLPPLHRAGDFEDFIEKGWKTPVEIYFHICTRMCLYSSRAVLPYIEEITEWLQLSAVSWPTFRNLANLGMKANTLELKDIEINKPLDGIIDMFYNHLSLTKEIRNIELSVAFNLLISLSFQEEILGIRSAIPEVGIWWNSNGLVLRLQDVSYFHSTLEAGCSNCYVIGTRCECLKKFNTDRKTLDLSDHWQTVTLKGRREIF